MKSFYLFLFLVCFSFPSFSQINQPYGLFFIQDNQVKEGQQIFEAPTLKTDVSVKVQGLILTTAFAAPMVAASGAITSLINGITGGGEESSDSAVAEKLDLILAAIKEGGDVIIDGNKVGESLMLASVKSS